MADMDSIDGLANGNPKEAVTISQDRYTKRVVNVRGY